MMINKALKIIDEKLAEVLTKRGFTNISEAENSLLFAKGEDGYKVFFDADKNKFELLECCLENGNITSEKVLSTWLFDPQNDTEKEVKDVAADFAETLGGAVGSVGKKASAKKKRKNDEENNSNPLFLMNRIASIFPELKEAVQEEKNTYEDFRAVTFAREKALPLIKEILTSGEPRDKFKKLCTVFSNLYTSGDLDTRSIITIVFLNAIDEPAAREKISAAVSDELKSAMKEDFKLKGKKIKPEKVKRKNTFISDTFNAAQNK